MHRTRTGKQIALTNRDIEIFRTLSRYRYLRSTYLHAFAGGASETRFKERLGDLFHEGYLDRPDQQWRFADALHAPVVYALGDGARRILAEHGAAIEASTFLSAGAHKQFAHSVMVCDCLASCDIAARDGGELRFIPWPEILAKAPLTTRSSPMPFRMTSSAGDVIPDGIFGLEYRRNEKKSYRFFALEADRGSMPVVRSDRRQTSILGKFAVYNAAISQRIHTALFGIPNLLVLIVTTSEQRKLEIMRRLHDQMGPSPLFLFKTLSEEGMMSPRRPPATYLLRGAWDRIGHPPLSLTL